MMLRGIVLTIGIHRHTIHYGRDLRLGCRKNQLLIHTQGVSFEEIVAILENGDMLDVLDHPNKEKYAHQKMYVVEIVGYVYLVPYVQDRKAQKKYLG